MIHESIRFSFNEPKATAAAAFLLKLHGGRMKYLRLIKLLYFAERESLRRFNRPICGDSYVSMKNGPVLSTVFNLVKDVPGQGVWRRVIKPSRVMPWSVTLTGKAPPSALSEAELDVLRDVHAEWKDKDQWKMVEATHGFPEWRDPGSSMFPIYPEDILRALDKTETDVEEVHRLAAETAHFDKLFGA
jgi:uncharacterized phage-associated protein